MDDGAASLDDEEKAMRSGGGMIIAAIALVVALVGGAAYSLMDDGSEQYGVIGRQLNGMKSEHFDSFWTCALPGSEPARFQSDQDLRYHLHKRARSGPSRYAEHVRERCLVKLSEHGPRLQQLIAPEDLQGRIDALGTSLESLQEGWTEYLQSLSTHQGSYDEDAFGPPVGKIAKGWYDYRRTHVELNRQIRERLQE